MLLGAGERGYPEERGARGVDSLRNSSRLCLSLIANYRSQFDRIVRANSYEELIRRLKHKRDEFLNESTPRAPRSSG